jgi:hypothetical protein
LFPKPIRTVAFRAHPPQKKSPKKGWNKLPSGRFYALQDFRKTEKLQYTMTVILWKVVFRRSPQEAKTRIFLILASETNKSEWALICPKE